jgi:hypothetical protein
MKLKQTFLATCVVLMLGGCKEAQPDLGAPISVRVYGVSGKKDLTPGLKLGLYVGEPIGVYNVPMTVSADGVGMLDREVNWKFNQSSSSGFFVYTPYDPSYSGQQPIIELPTDQSTEDKFLSANMLTGLASGSRRQTTVDLTLAHAMTAMSVSFENKTGEIIRSISVTGLISEGILDIETGGIEATGASDSITPLHSSDGSDAYCFLYVPQEGKPMLNIEMESGKSITITFDAPFPKNAGKVIRKEGIILRENMLSDGEQNIQILPMEGANITEWPENGVPDFPLYKESIAGVFAGKSAYGWYDLSQPDTVIYAFSGKDGNMQLSVRRYETGRSFQQAHTASGEVHFFYVYDCPSKPILERSYTVAFNVMGKTEQKGFTKTLECIKVDNRSAWLMDKSCTVGIILAL